MAHLSALKIQRIRKAREDGMTFRKISETFQVSLLTAMRHGDPKHETNLRKLEKQREAKRRNENVPASD